VKRLLLGLMVLAAFSARAALPDEVLLNGVEFRRIPEGPFWYVVETDYPNNLRSGQPALREVRVVLSEYYIAKHEARAADYARFLNSKSARQDFIGDPLYWTPIKDGCTILYHPEQGFLERYPGRNLPATAMSWHLARDFASAMGFRLPTEAEWQKAYRGSDQRIWPWGNDFPDETHANFLLSAHCSPAPVDSYPKGRSPYGLHHMAGNVTEATANWYNLAFDQSLRNGVLNPPAPEEPAVNSYLVVPTRIFKGGRWGSVPGVIAIGYRDTEEEGAMNSSSGVRFAVDALVVARALAEGRATVLDAPQR
jgi:formylglycine-generating enzyme required for sulfatase activity